ncbi:ADAMTS-like protein 4 [Pelobates fuscus]|uniref:ADAMTS-like protein 4 n=1 Tax=Pelobates fuscus TaxID=191477 RepID=UPI002FE4BCC0
MFLFGCLLLFLNLMAAQLCRGSDQIHKRTLRQTLEDGAVENKITGTWSSWGPWSSCSQTCGLGVLERSRSCLAPYQQVPWVPGAELGPHIIQTQPQPPFHNERPNPYPFGGARPSYPLHNDGEIAAPYTDQFVPRNPSYSRYNPFNRHTRQETFPSGLQPTYQRRDHSTYQRGTSNRARSALRQPEPGWQPAEHDAPHLQEGLLVSEPIPNHRNIHRDPLTSARKNHSRHDDPSQSWPFFPDSIPLLKPDSYEDQNLGRASPVLSPTKEPRFSTRRSRVRNSIKPGKYGYGRVPFALPLHRDKEDPQRFKRHHKPLVEGATAAPKREKGKDLHSTLDSSTEDLEATSVESPDQALEWLSSPSKSKRSSHKKQKQSSLTEHPSWPQTLWNSTMIKDIAGIHHRQFNRDLLEHESHVDINVEFIAEGQDQGLNVKKTGVNHRFHVFSPIHVRDSSNHGHKSSHPTPTSHEADDDDQPYNVFRKNTKINASSTRTSIPVEESFSGLEGQRIPSTHTLAFKHSEKSRGSANHEDAHVARKARLKTISTPRSYMSFEDQSHMEKKEEARRMSKSFSTVKPAQKRLVGQRVDIPVKFSDSSFHSDKKTLVERNIDQGFQRLVLKDHVKPLHNWETRPSKVSDATRTDMMQGEEAQHSHQPLPQSPNLPRSRSQRQSPYRQSADSSRIFQSLFRDNPPVLRPLQTDPWLALGSNPAVHSEREPESRPGLHQNSDVSQYNLYNPGSEEFHCVGEQKQYKPCSQEPCPANQPDSRTLQCATFNNQEFMGRLYQWEAFTEVNGNQRCALNCRPVGYRFYVRHTEKVQDGTSCEAGSSDICVGGQCLSPGCDGILGSNSTLDTCGVCGGDSSTCKFITGTFKDTNVPIGYHKILEIPKGATQISVRELTWSPNYLALRSRNGKSIINGNWAIDPPGRYEAGDTAFIYTQPGREDQEGETFTAAGPTSEALDVYMIFQQDNPGISFQFFISSPPSSEHAGQVPNLPQQEYGALRSMSSSDPLPLPISRSHAVEERIPVSPPQPRPPPPRPAGTLQRNIRIPPLQPPPVHYWPEQPEFFWKRVGNTPCSVTCGKGFWYPIFQCVSRNSLEEVGDEECDPSTKPFSQEEACNTQPCPAFWDVGNWSVCSRTCGSGIQHRQVLCRQMYANRTTMVQPQRCSNLVKPNVTQTCQLRICSHWEIQSNWTTCSVMCGIGQKTRHVRCISNHGDMVSEGECNNRLRPRTNEACDMGPCVRSWFHNEWSPTCSSECGPGIQRRSVFCLSSSPTDESQEGCTGSKPSDMKVCNSGPCERTVRWYTGPWSQCSADCDEGSQRRDVICVSKLGTEFNITDQSECSHLDKPASLQSCNAGSCGSRWFTSPWSACSQSCLGGVQTREVRCLASDRTYSHLCDLDSKPEERKVCNTQPCSAVLDENCRDRFHNCAVVVQARLCVYAYYKQACCSSCTHSLIRSPTPDSR